MSLRDVRRLGAVALALVLLPNLIFESLWFVAKTCEIATGMHLWQDMSGVALVGTAFSLFFVVVACTNTVELGRFLAPEGLTAAAAILCAALRVYCVWQRIAVIPQITIATMLVGVWHGNGPLPVAPLSWVAAWGIAPLMLIALFVAAPWIAKWVIGQVDSGVMWWSSLFRWYTRVLEPRTSDDE
jgi:hypothetical protein